MAITATFTANFSDFFNSVNAAKVSLKGFEADADKVGKTLSNMVDQFSGRKVIEQATEMTTVVNALGGVSKLSAAELQKLGAIAEEAARKLRMWGQEVPQSIQAVAVAARNARGEMDPLTAGMIAAGKAASDSGKMLAGMGAAGQLAAAQLTAVKKDLDPLALGMSAAGKAASDSGKLLAGMGAAGREAAQAAQQNTQALSPMLAVLDALKPKSENAAEAFTQLKGTLVGMWEHPAEAAMQFAGALVNGVVGALGMVGTVAVGAAAALTAEAAILFELTKRAAEAGERIQDMNEKTGISVPGLSRLGNAATIAGGNIEQIGNAIFMFDRQMVESSDRVSKGLEKIGLSFAEIKRMSPEAQFEAISTALRGMADPMTRNAAASDIFGKSARELLPLIMNLGAAMERTNGLSVWTAEQTAQAQAFNMDMRALQLAVGEVALAIGKDLLPLLQRLSGFAAQHAGGLMQAIVGGLEAAGLDQLRRVELIVKFFESFGAPAPPKVNPTVGVTGAKDTATVFDETNKAMQEQVVQAALLDNHLRNLAKAGADLTDVQKTQATAMLAGGDSAQDAAKWLGVAEVKVTELKAALEKGKEAATKFAQAQKDYATPGNDYLKVIDRIGNSTYEGIKYDLARGKSVETLALVYGVTAQTIRDVANAEKAYADNKALIASVAALESNFQNVSEAAKQASDDELRFVNAQMALNAQIKLAFPLMEPMIAGFENIGDAIGSVGRKSTEIDEVKTHLQIAAKAAADFKLTFRGSIESAFAELPRIFEQAFTGGGGLVGGIKAMGVFLGGEFAKGFNASLKKDIGNTQAGGGLELSNETLKNAGAAGGIAGAFAAAGGGSISAQLAQVGLAASVSMAAVIAAEGAATVGAVAMAGAVTFGVGAAAIGIALLVKHYATLTQAEKDARKAFDEFQKIVGASNVDDVIAKAADAYRRMGIDGETARQAIQRVLDATHESPQAVAAALAPIAAVMDQAAVFDAAVDRFRKQGATAFNAIVAGTGEAVKGYEALKRAVEEARKAAASSAGNAALAGKALTDALADQAKAAGRAKQELADLGLIAVTQFSAAVASGLSLSQAVTAMAPGLETLRQSYEDLGLDVDNAALKVLFLQSAIVTNNPQLLAAVGGLAGEMQALSDLGLLNADTFAAMQRTGLEMYSRLQSAAAEAGGTTADALLPMQDYLHEAEEAAKKLGVPLDANTQLLIDQSKELGLWREKGKSDQDIMLDGMNALVKAVKELVEQLAAIPRDITTNVHVNTVTDSGGSPDGGQYGGMVTSAGIRRYARGGIVLPWRGKGTDTVPAMLTPGESVLTRAATARLGSDVIGRLNRGGGGGDGGGGGTVLDFATMRSELAGLRADMAKQRDHDALTQTLQPRALARAIRDALAG